MEPRELLKALVDMVAALGELAATVAGPDGDVEVAMYPRSLRKFLGTFTLHLCESLLHHYVTYLEHHNVISLGQALAALGATPGTSWADVRATVRAWWELMDKLAKSWWWVDGDATKLLNTWENTGTPTPAADAIIRIRELCDKITGRGTAGDNLAAAAPQPPGAPPSAATAHEGWAAEFNKVMQEAVLGTRTPWAAISRGPEAKAALELLGRLVAAYDKASVFPWELQRRLGDIELALVETKEASRDVPRALVAAAAEFERLWEASARLATCHLLGTLGDIHNLLSSPSGSPISSGGPGGCTVAEQCQKAIKDIPRLLGGQ